MGVYALIGHPLSHSFSKAYFTSKFEREGLNHQYINVEIDSLSKFDEHLESLKPQGLNVTIPYKESIIPFLNSISPEAKEIGAVNTIKISNNGFKSGFNTDHIGIRETLKPLLKPYHTSAFILGTGGAAKAVAYVLKQLGIDFHFVSRSDQKKEKTFHYNELTAVDIRNAPLLINTSPLGSFPDIESYPDIPYSGIDKFHLLFDLVYNPAETVFLKKGTLEGAQTVNGYKMLLIQAEEAWKIWNSEAY